MKEQYFNEHNGSLYVWLSDIVTKEQHQQDKCISLCSGLTGIMNKPFCTFSNHHPDFDFIDITITGDQMQNRIQIKVMR